MKPLEKAVRAAALKYYATKKLGLIAIYKNQEQLVDVKLWSVGVHSCLNSPGGRGGYVGAVPRADLSDVEIYVFHKP